MVYAATKKWDELLTSLNQSIRNALLGEVYTTPKPGLVDCWDSGAHRDMDCNTFVKSTKAIQPYLLQMIQEGHEWKDTLPELFLKIREIGKQAEKAMFLATDGVNTHKGIIFTMGILCAAAGYCYRLVGKFNIDMIFDIAREMTEEILKKEFLSIQKREAGTYGEYLYQTHGEKGIRGEAMMGFPILREYAFPTLHTLRYLEEDENLANLHVLFIIMAKLQDTNVIKRGGYPGLWWIQKKADTIIKKGSVFATNGIAAVRQWNRECIKKNISSGGAADLLAATLFLYQLEKWNQAHERKM